MLNAPAGAVADDVAAGVGVAASGVADATATAVPVGTGVGFVVGSSFGQPVTAKTSAARSTAERMRIMAAL